MGVLIYTAVRVNNPLKSNTQTLDNYKSEVNFNNIHGLDFAKNELTEIINFLKDPKMFAFQN